MQSHILALQAHCKEHDSLNHYNCFDVALCKLALKFIVMLCNLALNYSILLAIFTFVKFTPGLKMYASEQKPFA